MPQTTALVLSCGATAPRSASAEHRRIMTLKRKILFVAVHLARISAFLLSSADLVFPVKSLNSKKILGTAS